MPVIRFPSRRTRAVDVVHPTTPRVGIFVKAQRARSTGPEAHESPYIADEERSMRRQVFSALAWLAVILASSYCSIHLAMAAWQFMRGLL